MKYNLTHLLLLTFLSIFITILPSCSKVKGCTDPDAETYNPEAESNDASQCIYSRDKFIGEYEGNLACLNPFLSATINGMTTFRIEESSKNVSTVDVTILTDPILRLEADVQGNSIAVNTFLPNVNVGNMILFDITVSGDLLLSSNQDTVSGILKIKPQNDLNNVEDNCDIVGTKK